MHYTPHPNIMGVHTQWILPFLARLMCENKCHWYWLIGSVAAEVVNLSLIQCMMAVLKFTHCLHWRCNRPIIFLRVWSYLWNLIFSSQKYINYAITHTPRRCPFSKLRNWNESEWWICCYISLLISSCRSNQISPSTFIHFFIRNWLSLKIILYCHICGAQLVLLT